MENSIIIPILWSVLFLILVGVLIYTIRVLKQHRQTSSAENIDVSRVMQENTELKVRLESLEKELGREKEVGASQLSTLQAERDELRKKNEDLRTKCGSLETQLATLNTRLEEERRSAQEKLNLLEESEKRLTTEFENLANRIFENKHQQFADLSKSSMESLLQPVREQISEFRKKIDDVYDKESRDRASLHHEITNLRNLNEKLSEEALNLTRALKGDSKVRGNWGEIQLERLLENSGLVKGREYEIQASLKNEEGQLLRPDVIIHLPEKKNVVVDSKISLVAYDQYHSSTTDEERQKSIRAHITSLRNHISSLSSKNYDELIGVNSLDLVIMFVPIEPALLLALEHEPQLYNEAFSRRILIVSPSTLMGTLQIIHNIWRHEHQNKNTQEIALQAGRLHDRFVLFIEALEDIGKNLDKAKISYELAHKRLTSGNGNLVQGSSKLKALGAKTKKEIPQNLQEEAAENALMDAREHIDE